MEQLQEMYDNLNNTGVTGVNYWKAIVLESIMNCKTEEQIKNMKITEEDITEIVDIILGNDTLWNEIDMAVINAIEEVK